LTGNDRAHARAATGGARRQEFDIAGEESGQNDEMIAPGRIERRHPAGRHSRSE